MGLLLPLLAGGNTIFLLEPEVGIRYFLLVAVGTAGVLAFDRKDPRSTDQTESAPAMLSILFLSILAVWWIGNLVLRPVGPRAAIEAQGLLGGILLYAALGRRPRSPGVWQTLSGGLLAGTLLTSLYAQYQYWVALPRIALVLQALGGPPVPMVNANFYNANCYAAFLASVLLLAAALAVESRSSIVRILAALGGAALLPTLLLTESRSTVALLAAAFVVAWQITRSPERPRRRIHPSTLLIAAVLAAGGVAAVAMIDLNELWKVGWLGRVTIWRGSLAMIRDHWLLGVGLGRFWDYFEQYRITTYYTRYPHNLLLEVFAELGIVGGLSLSGFLLTAFAGPVGRLRLALRTAGPRPIASVLVVLAAGLLVAHALFDIDWHAPANPVLLLLLLAVAQNLEC